MSTTKVQRTCPECEGVHHVTVPKEGYARWKAGELIQNAMPEMDPDDRETLRTGVCPPCWDRLLPPAPEDEDEELPGMWDQADLSGGRADAEDEARGKRGLCIHADSKDGYCPGPFLYGCQNDGPQCHEAEEYSADEGGPVKCGSSEVLAWLKENGHL